MKTVVAEVDDEQYKQEMIMRKKQEALNVTMKSLRSFIDEDLVQTARVQPASSEFLESELELEEFEERLKRSTWKDPKDEMKGWKTGAWSPRKPLQTPTPASS